MRAVSKLTCALLLGTAALAPAAELQVGDPAPDFTLAGSDGKTYTLSQFKGKKAVVLAWFPKAFTSGCTVECKSLAANGDKLRQYEVAYFMASVDAVDGREGQQGVRRVGEGRLPDPERPDEGDGDRLRRAPPGARLRAALDLLHRQGRQDRGDRQGRQAADVSRGRDRAARRAQGPEGPLARSAERVQHHGDGLLAGERLDHDREEASVAGHVERRPTVAALESEERLLRPELERGSGAHGHQRQADGRR